MKNGGQQKCLDKALINMLRLNDFLDFINIVFTVIFII